MNTSVSSQTEAWPSLPLEAWSDTSATLRLWLQVVGKVRLMQSPWLNHSWHVTLMPSASGLITPLIPYGNRAFQIEFDFVRHRLKVRSTDGGGSGFALEPQSVATFYRRFIDAMARLDLHVRIDRIPNEMPDVVPFDRDEVHRAYDPDYANRFWRVLVQADRVLTIFRARFIGKCSPVHVFWGSADLAVTRFSGRTAPPHPGGVPHLPDWVAREAYSHEVSSCGFWAGGGAVPFAVFYSYAYPAPPGFSSAAIAPDNAYYSAELGEFILPYDRVREAPNPDATVLEFLQTTYTAAADLGHWDRAALERRGDPRDLH